VRPMTTTPIFAGAGVALVTLFDDGGDLDAAATSDLAARLVDAGVEAVVVAGTTGEAAALDREERVCLLDAVRAAVPEPIPVLAGTGAPSARQAAILTRDAAEHGAAGALVLSPPGASDIRPYYEAVAAAAPVLPLLAYHFPAVSAPGIPVEVLPDLPVVGCKDSSGDPARLVEAIETWDGHLYTGSSWLLSFAGPLGCTGAILAVANAEPEGCAAALAGDPAAQRALTLANLAARQGRLKELVAQRWGTSPVRRLL